jgi:hypothetical protein
MYRWHALRTETEKYIPLFKGMESAFWIDDRDGSVPLIDILMSKLQTGEIYFAFSGDKFVGLSAITNINYGHSGTFEGIARPEYINSYPVGQAFGELLTYAFGDYGEAGLGLKKLHAHVARPNERVVSMLMKAGFQPCGIWKFECLYQGIPQDMMLLEYLNPKYFAVQKDILNVKPSISAPVHRGQQALASQVPYTQPAPLAQAQSATGNVGNISTGPQVSGLANQTMAGAPSWLNLNNYNNTANPSAPGGTGGPFNQQLMQQMSNWYLQNQVQPQVSAAQAQMQSGGQNYGSYGPAMAGQMMGQGQQSAFQAALAANQQQFQDVLGGNQAYYQGPAALSAQQGNLQVQSQLEQAALNNTMNIANMESANQYDLGAAGMQNQYNLQLVRFLTTTIYKTTAIS